MSLVQTTGIERIELNFTGADPYVVVEIVNRIVDGGVEVSRSYDRLTIDSADDYSAAADVIRDLADLAFGPDGLALIQQNGGISGLLERLDGIEQIEVHFGGGEPAIFIKRARRIFDGGVEVAKRYSRDVLTAANSYAGQAAIIQAIAPIAFGAIGQGQIQEPPEVLPASVLPPVVPPPTSAGMTIPELAADPAAPVVGEAWVLRTLVNPAGTLQGFAGGFPLVLAEDQNRFDLSISTTDGTRRVQIT